MLFRTAAADCARLCTEEEYSTVGRRKCMTSCVRESVHSLQNSLLLTPRKKWVDSLTFAKRSRHIPEKKWVDSLTFAKRSRDLPEKKWVDSLTFAKRDGDLLEKKWVDSLTFHKRDNLEKKWVDSLTFAKRDNPEKKWVDSLTFHKRDDGAEIETGERDKFLDALSKANRRKMSDDKRWVDSLSFHKRTVNDDVSYEDEEPENQDRKIASQVASYKPKKRARRWVDELDYGKRNSHLAAGIQKRWVDELHYGKRNTREVQKKREDSLHFKGKRGFDDLLELCIEERCVGLKGDAFDQCSGELCVEPMMHNRESIERRLQRRQEQPSAFCKFVCHSPEKRDLCLTFCV